MTPEIIRIAIIVTFCALVMVLPPILSIERVRRWVKRYLPEHDDWEFED